MTTQVNQLENASWFRDCDGPSVSMIDLAPKPHQGHITAIDNWVAVYALGIEN